MLGGDLVAVGLVEGPELDADLRRGELLDRNGNPLVTNRQGNSVVFESANFPVADSERNALIYSLIRLFEINGEEWCKLDIRMNMQGQTGRQISFYRQKGNYIYNIKFGNNTTDVEKNLVVIDSIMTSVKIL